MTVLGGALCFGADDRVGHTFWQSVDSSLLGAATAAVMKPVFGRSRPSQTDDPGEWSQGSGHNSFPSGEVMLTTAVTSFVFEYGPEHPAVYALELLPSTTASRGSSRRRTGRPTCWRALRSEQGSAGMRMSANCRYQ